ncbi:MAG: MazG nucleotide pyrophosphohydrolase domain-containing protein [Candidatus Bruticola sp.]
MSELSFRDFQKFIHLHYQKYDSERGVGRTFMWLMEEIGELASALQNIHNHPEDEQVRRNVEEEFADVLGWLSTLANMHHIDLEQALRSKYLDKKSLTGHKP